MEISQVSAWLLAAQHVNTQGCSARNMLFVGSLKFAPTHCWSWGLKEFPTHAMVFAKPVLGTLNNLVWACVTNTDDMEEHDFCGMATQVWKFISMLQTFWVGDHSPFHLTLYMVIYLFVGLMTDFMCEVQAAWGGAGRGQKTTSVVQTRRSSHLFLRSVRFCNGLSTLALCWNMAGTWSSMNVVCENGWWFIQ